MQLNKKQRRQKLRRMKLVLIRIMPRVQAQRQMKLSRMIKLMEAHPVIKSQRSQVNQERNQVSQVQRTKPIL